VLKNIHMGIKIVIAVFIEGISRFKNLCMLKLVFGLILFPTTLIST